MSSFLFLNTKFKFLKSKVKNLPAPSFGSDLTTASQDRHKKLTSFSPNQLNFNIAQSNYNDAISTVKGFFRSLFKKTSDEYQARTAYGEQIDKMENAIKTKLARK